MSTVYVAPYNHYYYCMTLLYIVSVCPCVWFGIMLVIDGSGMPLNVLQC